MSISNNLVKVIQKADEVYNVEIISNSMLDEAYKLRYQIFHNNLQWIEERDERRDVDSYDAVATHFASYSRKDGRMIAYCRVIFPSNKFMLEKEFKRNLNGYSIENKESSIEISRLVMNEEGLKMSEKIQALMLLYRRMYCLLKEKDVRYCYIVVTEHYLKKLQTVFPFKQIGEKTSYQAGVETVAAHIDLKEFEEKYKDSYLLNWFSSFKCQT